MHRECRDINLGAGLAAAHPDAASGQHGERADFRGHPHVHWTCLWDCLVSRCGIVYAWLSVSLRRFGVYFDIEAKDTPLTIKSIETGCSRCAIYPEHRQRQFFLKQAFMRFQCHAHFLHCRSLSRSARRTRIWTLCSFVSCRCAPFESDIRFVDKPVFKDTFWFLFRMTEPTRLESKAIVDRLIFLVDFSYQMTCSWRRSAFCLFAWDLLC